MLIGQWFLYRTGLVPVLDWRLVPACTGLETGPCTGLETGPCTGLETGPCTGLETGSCTGLETGSRTVMVAVIIKTSRVQDPLVTSQHSTMLDNTKPNVPQHVLYYTIIHYLVQWVSKLL